MAVNHRNGNEIAGLFLGGGGLFRMRGTSYELIRNGRKLELVFDSGNLRYADIGPAPA